MDFIMQAFKRQISRYPFKFILEKKTDSYYLEFYNLPMDLDCNLLNLRYQIAVEEPEMETKSKKYISDKVTIQVCSDKKDENGNMIVFSELHSYDYAEKINRIGACLRRYIK